MIALIRFILRLSAAFLLAMAVVAAVLDATRSVAADRITLMPLGELWSTISPGTYEAALAALAEAGPFDGALEVLLSLPGSAMLALLALVFYGLGRRRSRRIGSFVVEN